ncbi:hypothetical protein PWT90_10385 [Aphanocladium album]|nr:hypothetical protein PWT90_10385 [Aphanocladium album]
MQFSTVLTTLFLAGSAMACANGPYKTGSACGGNCANAKRCGDGNHIIQCLDGYWRSVQACKHCKFGSCA